MGRWGDREMRVLEDTETGRWGDGEMGRWGDGEMRAFMMAIARSIWGDGEIGR
ncbi:hypothetical protein [Okeania sp. SIO2B3]|uniref:hypothetical protein n=1 Tax=Okeania sp. SIO2B3 TaxID=2607784 RepID=UPI0025F2B2B5|nr:hypothetical protein [Okeania sp. SIO2B3]